MRRFSVLDPGSVGSTEQIGAGSLVLADGEGTAPARFDRDVEQWLLVVGGSPRVSSPAGAQVLRKGDVLCIPIGEGAGHAVTGPGSLLLISADQVP